MSAAGGSDGGLIEAALSIGQELAASAEPAGEGRTWWAEVIVGVEQGAAVIGRGDVGATLYDGAAGIALALAACAQAAPPGTAATLSEAARAAARRALADAPELLEQGRLGLFDGATGIALGAVTSGRLCGDDALAGAGTAIAHDVCGRLQAPPQDAELDLIGGLAGTMLGLQSIFTSAAPPLRLEAATERLSAAAQPQTWGAAWSAGPGEAPLLGLGHGAAGIALALTEAAAADGDERASRVAAEGIAYERSWFDPGQPGWPDLRGYDGASEPGAWTAAWCHGAIGIGISRLRLAQLSPDPALQAEASAALQAARGLVIDAGNRLRAGETADCTLCHGLAGVVELLLLAARSLDVAEHKRAARRVAGLILEQHQAAGSWPCGLPGAGQVPGLMTGTAGIALTLLRAGDAVDVPSPLLPGPAGW